MRRASCVLVVGIAWAAIRAGVPPDAVAQAPLAERPDGHDGCIRVATAQIRVTFPPRRFAIYDRAGDWLGDAILSEACGDITAQTQIYVPGIGTRWGRLCGEASPIADRVWVNGSRCPVESVVDPRRVADPPDPVAELLRKDDD